MNYLFNVYQEMLKKKKSVEMAPYAKNSFFSEPVEVS